MILVVILYILGFMLLLATALHVFSLTPFRDLWRDVQAGIVLAAFWPILAPVLLVLAIHDVLLSRKGKVVGR